MQAACCDSASMEVLPLTGKEPGVHLKNIHGGKQIFLEAPSGSELLIASLSLCLSSNQALPLSVGVSQ